MPRSELCIALFCLSITAHQTLYAAAEHPQAALSLSLSQASTNSPNELLVELTNDSDQRLELLTWETPFEAGFSANTFTVINTNTGESLPYIGRHTKLASHIPPESLKPLNPGEQIAGSIDLGALYLIEQTAPYTITWSGTVRYRQAKQNAPQLQDLTHQTLISASITQYLAPAKSPLSGRKVQRQTCSNYQATQILLAEQSAFRLAEESTQSLAELPEPMRFSSPRYNRWFGDYQPAYYNKIEQQFAILSTLLDNGVAEYDCSCSSDHYAYVYPHRPYEVFLCNGFWQASREGYNSQAGTLIHEFSHFTAIAGTQDHAYGQHGAAALASLNAASAMNNADNYEYFAENTPYLPMASAQVNSSTNHTLQPRMLMSLSAPAAHTDQIKGGEASAFKVTDVRSIELQAQSGQVGLQVFSQSGMNVQDLLCNTVSSAGQRNRCELKTLEQPYYVAVIGLSANGATYQLKLFDTANQPSLSDDFSQSALFSAKKNGALGGLGLELGMLGVLGITGGLQQWRRERPPLRRKKTQSNRSGLNGA